MNYSYMEPPFEMKDFDDMSRKEAKTHFEWYVQQIPSRLELLRRFYTETGGGEPTDLDFSKQSLLKVWSWFLPKIEIIYKTKKKLEEEAEIYPEWLHDEIMSNTKMPSMHTLCVAMDISIYLAETLIHNNNNLRWDIITKPKSLYCVNRPIVVGFRDGYEVYPSGVLHNKILRAIDGKCTPRSLYNSFEVFAEEF